MQRDVQSHYRRAEHVRQQARKTTIFSDGESSCQVEDEKARDSQRGHVRDAEGRSARLLLTLNISPCSKKSRKKPAPRSVQSLLVETRFTWKPQTVTVPSVGRPDQPTVSTCSASCNGQRVVRDITNSSRAETKFHCRWRFIHQFLGGLVRELKQDVAVRGCSRNVLRTFLCEPRSPKENSCKMIAHSSLLSSPK